MAQHFTRVRVFFLALILFCITAWYFISHSGEESTDDAAIDAHVVTISPRVPGYIKALYMEDNKPVKAGDLLLEIDPMDYVLKRDQARAQLEAAISRLHAAQANWEKASRDLKRLQRLSREARSPEQMDAAIAAERNAHAALEGGEENGTPKGNMSAKPGLSAQVKEAEAVLAQAEKDLSDTRIFAAQDGRIARRSVEQGDYVQPGAQLGFIVGTDLWVVANYKETQLKHMHLGDPVLVRIDAFPRLRLNGKVGSIQRGTGARFSAFPPENATGNFVKVVQRVPVKILLDAQPDPAIPVGVGMSVEPTVYTK